MISQSYTQTASGLIVPRSNGYANRILVDQVGAGTLTLPPWAKSAKVALLGSGGSGATQSYNGGNTYNSSAGGGGPLVIALFDLEQLGRSFNYVLGAGGISPSVTTSGLGLAGNAGAISSVVWGTRTLTANPGQGGLLGSNSNSAPAIAGGLGGIGTGGDFNFSGGQGGGSQVKATANTSVQLGGGGSSGRPWGNGLKGGCFAAGLTSQSAGNYAFPGASWGFSGEVSDISEANNYNNVSGGHGVLGKAPPLSGTPGAGAGDFVGITTTSTQNNALYAQTPRRPWWDLDDMCGWGGAWFAIPRANNTDYAGIQAGDGGSGGCAASDGTAYYAVSSAYDGGFGGGGGGVYISTNTIEARAGHGGRGAGGGVCMGYNPSNNRRSVGGKGGDAWLGVWFN